VNPTFMKEAGVSARLFAEYRFPATQ